MNFASLLLKRKPECANKLVAEGFAMKVFDKLKVKRVKPVKEEQTELFQEKWHVVDASGVVLREFLHENEAEQYKNFISGLKLHDVDQLIISLSKQLKAAKETIQILEEELRQSRKSLDGQ